MAGPASMTTSAVQLTLWTAQRVILGEWKLISDKTVIGQPIMLSMVAVCYPPHVQWARLRWNQSRFVWIYSIWLGLS